MQNRTHQIDGSIRPKSISRWVGRKGSIPTGLEAPKPIAENLELIPDLNMKQTMLTEPQVTLLGPNAAMRTSIVKLEGDYKGEPLPERVYKPQIIVKRDGK